jgi:hypothetical protein
MTNKFLTATQVRQLDEISADRDGNERTLQVALNFHSNAMNQIHKRRVQFWRELAEIHDLDPTQEYACKYVAGRYEIVVVKSEGEP